MLTVRHAVMAALGFAALSASMPAAAQDTDHDLRLECPGDRLWPEDSEMYDTPAGCIGRWKVGIDLKADWSKLKPNGDLLVVIDFGGTVFAFFTGERLQKDVSDASTLATWLKTLPPDRKPEVWMQWHRLARRPEVVAAIDTLNQAGYTPKASADGQGTELWTITPSIPKPRKPPVP